MPQTLPMFPLGTVLLPGMLLPLHVFEPRFRALVDDVLAADHRFGVVLIERGHEVGGHDHRTMVGTVAQVLRAEQFDDGRWVIIGVGTHRIRVQRWLPDDPYPRAEVDAWDDEDVPVDDGLRCDVDRRLRRVLALASELGEAVPDVDLAEDPLTASFQAAILSPVGPQDAHRLLCEPDARARLARLAALLDEHEDLLRFRLGGTAG